MSSIKVDKKNRKKISYKRIVLREDFFTLKKYTELYTL